MVKADDVTKEEQTHPALYLHTVISGKDLLSTVNEFAEIKRDHI
jgi:hypothetical protein